MITQEKFTTKEELISEKIPLIINEDFANNFLIITIGNCKYGLAWNGKTELEVELFEKFNLIVCAIGQKVLAFNQSTGAIQLCLGLGFPFLFFEKSPLGFAIVSELTIIAINGFDCSISRFIIATDIIQDLKIEGENYIVQCLDTSFTA